MAREAGIRRYVIRPWVRIAWQEINPQTATGQMLDRRLIFDIKTFTFWVELEKPNNLKQNDEKIN